MSLIVCLDVSDARAVWVRHAALLASPAAGIEDELVGRPGLNGVEDYCS